MEQLQSVLLGAVILLIPVITKYVIQAVNLKTEQLKAKTENEKLNGYIALAADTVTDVVASLNQSTVEKLKAAAADGKLNDEEIADIKATALNTTLDILGPDIKNALSTVLGDTEAWLLNKIDRTVVNLKNTSTK